MSVPAHLLAKTDGVELESLLSDWRWLVQPNLKPILVTALGDLFLRDGAGQVHFLDTMTGDLKQVAESQDAFEQLCEDRGYRRNYFQGFFVMELRKLRGELAPGECYSCEIPLSLGGESEPENFERTDLPTHFSVLGQLHRQTKHLPAGTQITNIKTESEDEDEKPKNFWQKFLGR